MCSHRLARFWGSSPVVGSSRKRTSGSWTMPERDVEAPALAARIGLHPPVGELDRSRIVGQLVDPWPQLGQAGPVEAPLEHQVLPPGGQLVGAAELAHVADALPHPLGCRGDVEPGHRGAAGVDRQQRREHAQGRGLAGAVRAEQPEDLARTDLEARLPGRPRPALCGTGRSWTAPR